MTALITHRRSNSSGDQPAPLRAVAGSASSPRGAEPTYFNERRRASRRDALVGSLVLALVVALMVFAVGGCAPMDTTASVAEAQFCLRDGVEMDRGSLGMSGRAWYPSENVESGAIRDHRLVHVYRCPQCGELRSYAP